LKALEPRYAGSLPALIVVLISRMLGIAGLEAPVGGGLMWSPWREPRVLV